MTEIIVIDDLPTALQAEELVEAMVAGANAKASRVAPCLTWDGVEEDQPAPSEDQAAEARLVLIGAIKRWSEAGSGALQAQNAGPFGITLDTRQKSSGYNLWPSEIEQLQEICASGTEGSAGAFSFSPFGCASIHASVCTLTLGGSYCSCGADIAGFPLYEIAP